jgi:hypothetical protein
MINTMSHLQLIVLHVNKTLFARMQNSVAIIEVVPIETVTWPQQRRTVLLAV